MKKHVALILTAVARCGACAAVTAPIFYPTIAGAADILTKAARFSIAPQALSSALIEFSAQSGIQIATADADVSSIRSPGVTGKHTVDQALSLLLKGTNLHYGAVGENTVAIKTSSTTAASSTFSERSTTLAESNTVNSSSAIEEEAQLADESSNKENLRAGKEEIISEVIVTAQKRDERLQDVPVPVTVLNAETLVDRGQNRLQDYFAAVPGLNLNAAANGGGTQTLSIRGVTTGALTNPTVGISIDDMPFGSSNILGYGGNLYPDFDPSDLTRIEVLRGPQGTLYGASSLGGLIKFVTSDPTTQVLSGRIQVAGEDAQRGGSGYAVRGALNVPVSDALAIRASGFARRDPGYVENLTTGQDDINRADVAGGRLSALWNISDLVSLKVSAMIQNTDGKGTPAVDTNQKLMPVLGDLKQERQRGTEGYSSRSRLYTSTLKAKANSFEFESISGYGTNKFSNVNDLSLFAPNWGEANDFETKKFSQEFRFTSTGDSMWQWMAGGFYTHESSPVDQRIVTLDAASGAHTGLVDDFRYKSSLSEYAVFGDLTIRFTDKFDVQVGGRESWDRQSYNETDTFVGFPPPVVTPTEASNTNDFTYLVTPRLKLTEDLMLYARFASGYRVGGPNVTAVSQGVPLTYGSDKTNNYEVGIKGDWLDHRLSYDGSVYYIDWKKIQIYLLNGFASYIANGRDAKSQGAEFSLQGRPFDGLTVNAAATYSDAKLKSALPPQANAVAAAGAHLPFSSKWSGSLSADQDFGLGIKAVGFVGASATYVGSRRGQFPTEGAGRLQFPSYTDFDLRSGVRYDSWITSLILSNVADKRGIVGGSTSFSGSGYDAVYIQPRTLSLSVSKSF